MLPFTNMSGDQEQEYFSDGITEDIITDLSKVAGLLVIARNSSFAYKGRSVDIRTVGRELGVRSVLEGSIRRAGNRVRITAQLIDAADGGHLWAERYDRDLTDIFAVQDEVTLQIVNALKVTLSPAEKARVGETGTSNVAAHDAFLHGRELILAPTKTRAAFEQSIEDFNKAIALDPGYGAAYAGLAMAHNVDFHNHFTGNGNRALEIAAGFADQAVKLGPNDPFARFVAAVVATFRGDFDRVATEVDAALALIRTPPWPMAPAGWLTFTRAIRCRRYRGSKRRPASIPRQSRTIFITSDRSSARGQIRGRRRPLQGADQAGSRHRHFARFPRLGPWPPRPRRRGARSLARAEGNQPGLFVRRACRPPAVP